jgi:shikimate kinase
MPGFEAIAGKNIYLIGYRGTGKTTVAGLLAAQLGREWSDLDAVLEAKSGRTIRQIFAEDSESGFRELEARILDELCAIPEHVVATGGGTVLRADNRQRLQAGGVVCWLKADAETISNRLQNDPMTVERRPQLTVGGIEEVRSLLASREHLYEACADLCVDTTGRSAAQVADTILAALTSAPV